MLLTLAVSCSSDDKDDSYTSPLVSAPTEIVEMKDLPLWLCGEIMERKKSVLIEERVCRCNYNGETVYAISNMFSSMYPGYEFFMSDGSSVPYAVSDIVENGRDWKCIYLIVNDGLDGCLPDCAGLPRELVGKADMPEWLSDKVETLESASSLNGYVCRSLWNGEVVYNIRHNFSPDGLNDTYNSRGERILYAFDTYDDFMRSYLDFCLSATDWKCIYVIEGRNDGVETPRFSVPDFKSVPSEIVSNDELPAWLRQRIGFWESGKSLGAVYRFLWHGEPAYSFQSVYSSSLMYDTFLADGERVVWTYEAIMDFNESAGDWRRVYVVGDWELM